MPLAYSASLRDSVGLRFPFSTPSLPVALVIFLLLGQCVWKWVLKVDEFILALSSKDQHGQRGMAAGVYGAWSRGVLWSGNRERQMLLLFIQSGTQVHGQSRSHSGWVFPLQLSLSDPLGCSSPRCFETPSSLNVQTDFSISPFSFETRLASI